MDNKVYLIWDISREEKELVCIYSTPHRAEMRIQGQFNPKDFHVEEWEVK